MNRRTKQICALTIALLIVACVAFLRNGPSASHQGYYVEKHLWSHTSSATAEEEVHATLKAWGKYNISNPTRHSIWITTHERKGSLGVPFYQYRLALGSACERSEGCSWHSLVFDCGAGLRIEEIEIPAGSTVTVLLECSPTPKSDVTALRIPYTMSPQLVTRGKFQEITDFIVGKSGLHMIPVPLQPLLGKHPDVVDRVVDERLPPPKRSVVR